MSPTGGRLAALLDAGEFVLTGEVVPPRSGSGAAVRDAARGLVGYVDAVNITLANNADNLDFGLVAARGSVPHMQRLLGHLEDSLAELERAVGV